MKWIITFIGRTKGALGARSEHVVNVEGSTQEAAIASLYDTHQDIAVLNVGTIDDTQLQRELLDLYPLDPRD